VAGAAVLLAALPLPARALHLLDERLTLDGGPPRALALAAAPALEVLLAAAAEDPSLDFDLLGEPAPVQSPDEGTSRWRHRMLKLHQGLGLGLLGLQLATTAVGQLAYSDKYGSRAPMTARYDATHGALAFTTLGVFAVNGGLALFAPKAKGKPDRGFDRVSLHKLGMAVATAGMLAQGALGIYTTRREGYLDQERVATAHLAIGYVTLAAVGVAVGALVF
jgi:hypothetical protein